MFIRKLILNNIKSFNKETSFTFSKHVNFLVGNNNSGKSTVLDSIVFLFNYSSRNFVLEDFISVGSSSEAYVIADICGEIESALSREDRKKLLPYVYDVEDDGATYRTLRIKRSTSPYIVNQNGKEVNIDIKKIAVWSEQNQQYENPSGIDAILKSLFDFEAVWANAQPDEHISFADNKTLGRLLKSEFEQFQRSDEWKKLEQAHNLAMSPKSPSSFPNRTAEICSGLSEIINQQYGHAEVNLEFTLPDSSSFLKNGLLMIDDGSVNTAFQSKGSGMQRATTLAAIQLYARREGAKISYPRPLILLLDEPETWMHPSAQLKLSESLGLIGTSDQVFVSTHSPYILRFFEKDSHQLIAFIGTAFNKEITSSIDLGITPFKHPTWSEITYLVFNISNPEFHNELFGTIQKYLDDKKPVGKTATMKEVDKFIKDNSSSPQKTWTHSNTNSFPTTLSVYIRNSIHHPENTANDEYTLDELKESIDIMIGIIKDVIHTVS